MADIDPRQQWLSRNKTWLVRLWFNIPACYVISETEEEKLFCYIVNQRENSYMARVLDCPRYVTKLIVIFAPRSNLRSCHQSLNHHDGAEQTVTIDDLSAKDQMIKFCSDNSVQKPVKIRTP